MTTPEVSHGRGGAGNITPDNTQYTDGEVVRAGPEGSHGDGAFSTGRGGAANIGDAHKKAGPRLDQDVVPEAAVRPSQDNSDYHVGRGGAGNEHISKDKAKEKKDNVPTGLADKLKHKIVSVFKK